VAILEILICIAAFSAMDLFIAIPEFLKTALEALPDAAKSPLAFVGYLGAIGSWVAIAWRVKRNKQLLKHLDKLPSHDRLKALELEMGSLPLAPGLTPDQWLKARIQRYYFLAFAIVCVLAVIVFAIASFRAKAADPALPLKEGIDSLDLGLSRDVVISKLGVPYSEKHFRMATCADYRFDFAYVQLLYDQSGQLLYYLVVAKKKDFNPKIPLQYDVRKRACLGCLSFSELLLPDEKPDPVYFNYSAHLFTYSEETPSYGRASRERSVQLSFLGAGVDFGSEIPMTDALEQVTKARNAIDTVSAEIKHDFLNFRLRTKPNAFAVYYDRLRSDTTALGLPWSLGIARMSGERDCEGNMADLSF
jgi:hypothetical protein